MSEDPLLCPSAQPQEAGARVFGVQFIGQDGRSSVAYLQRTLAVTPEVLALSGPADPAEVLRVAAPCMNGACLHHDGGACTLAARVASLLPPVVSSLPRCAVRPGCRWFREQGPQACVRCPQVVTNARADTAAASAEVAYADGVAPALLRQ